MTFPEPSYEELLEDNKKMYKEVLRFRLNEKQNNLVHSVMVGGFMLLIFSIYLLFAFVGADHLISEMSLAQPWTTLIYLFFKLGQVTIALYIAWHVFFVILVNYDDEVMSLVNQVKSWFKTRQLDRAKELLAKESESTDGTARTV